MCKRSSDHMYTLEMQSRLEEHHYLHKRKDSDHTEPPPRDCFDSIQMDDGLEGPAKQ